MKKVERLSVAAAVAPVLRGQAESVKKRRIYLTSPGGEVTGVTTNEELQASMLLRARIEFDVSEGVKETHRECALCGKPFALEGHGSQIRTCDGCRTRQTKCAGDGCEMVPPRSAFRASVVAKRKGAPWMCVACRLKDPEHRAKRTEAMRRRFESPEWLAKHAEATRRRSESPEWRARSAEANRRKAQGPEWRAKNAEANRRTSQDPECRAKRAEAMRRKHEDPEYRAKQAENLRRAREAKRAKNEQRPGAASTTEGERE